MLRILGFYSMGNGKSLGGFKQTSCKANFRCWQKNVVILIAISSNYLALNPMLSIFGWIPWIVCLHYLPSAITEHSIFRMASGVTGHFWIQGLVQVIEHNRSKTEGLVHIWSGCSTLSFGHWVCSLTNASSVFNRGWMNVGWLNSTQC